MIFKLKPILTYNLWGGEKLSKLYNEKPTQYGEAWILSCLNGKDSLIEGSDKTIKDLFTENPDIVSKGYKGDFPLLIKLIDAQQDLSIQVHPDAKTESWHILSNEPSKLYIGFKQNTSRKEIEDELTNGDITKKLNHIEVKEKDTFLITPGTIHAIGAGTFLIEIQRSADVTYRLYDFHRKDKNGKERELHINQALDVINYKKLNITQSKKKNLLVKCKFFKVYRDELHNEVIQRHASKKSFHSLVVVSGKGSIKQGDTTINIHVGDSLFIPAGTGEYSVKGTLSLITTTL